MFKYIGRDQSLRQVEHFEDYFYSNRTVLLGDDMYMVSSKGLEIRLYNDVTKVRNWRRGDIAPLNTRSYHQNRVCFAVSLLKETKTIYITGGEF